MLTFGGDGVSRRDRALWDIVASETEKLGAFVDRVERGCSDHYFVVTLRSRDGSVKTVPVNEGLVEAILNEERVGSLARCLATMFPPIGAQG